MISYKYQQNDLRRKIIAHELMWCQKVFYRAGQEDWVGDAKIFLSFILEKKNETRERKKDGVYVILCVLEKEIYFSSYSS